MMEVEREKREKLASARRKLNEYKLSRSTGKTAPAGSSKPADVPNFYQNINSPPSSYNFFNPAAVADNNNVSSSSPLFAPTTEINQTPFSAPEINSGTSPIYQMFDPSQSQSFLQDTVNVSEHPSPVHPASIFQPQYYTAPDSNNGIASQDPTPVTSTSAESQDCTMTHPSSTANVGSTPSLFSVPSLVAESSTEEPLIMTFAQGGGDVTQPLLFAPSSLPPPDSINENLTSFLTPDSTSADFQSTGEPITESVEIEATQLPQHLLQTTEVPSGSREYLPSAPPIEPTSDKAGNEESRNSGMGDVELAETVPMLSSKLVETEFASHVDPVVGEPDPLDTTPKMFASSLFGSLASGNPDIFKVSRSSPFDDLTSTSLNETSKAETQPTVFNPFTTSAPLPLLESLDHELPVFEVIEKSDLQSSFQNEGVPVSPEDEGVKVGSRNQLVEEQAIPPADRPVPAPQSSLHHHMQQQQVKPEILSQLEPPISTQFSHESHHGQQQIIQQQDSSLQLHAQEENTNGDLQQLKSVQEALELQIEELRRENNYLLNRQTELTLKIEDSERLAHEFKLEKDRVKEESLTTSQALRGKINSLCEENQRIVKNSTDVGVDLRAKLEEKSRQLEEMQKAAIILSQSKMDFASRLDHEGERFKELQKILHERDEEIAHLKSVNTDLQEKLRQEQQKDAVIHQLQDQARHYQVQTETLQRELEIFRRRLRTPSPSVRPASAQSAPDDGQFPVVHGSGHGHSADCHEHHHEECHTNDGGQSSSAKLAIDQGAPQDHQTHESIESDEKTETDAHNHSASCDHDHHHHDHSHGDHDHSDNHHDHAHEGEGSDVNVVAPRGPADEVTELKKTLHRLEWENLTFRNELDVLAVDAKQKRSYEEKCASLTEENEGLKKQVEQLEHVIIQLQGENDTIGDYITLYQSQKLALRECAKEKDAQLEYLAKEREMLIQRLADLTALVNELKDSRSEAGSQCADDHMHSHLDVPHNEGVGMPGGKRQIEGKIRDLLTEISSSSLMENFHPCAVCSGRLMTV